MENSKKIKLFLLGDLLFFALCCFGIYFISVKASLPFDVISYQDQLKIINGAAYKIPDNSELLSIENYLIDSREQIEFLLDGKNISDAITVTYSSQEVRGAVKIPLTNFYNPFYIISAALTGLVFFILGIFVLIKCRANKVAALFHWIAVSVAGIIMLSWGKYADTFFEAGYLTRILFHLAYLMAPAMFIHFALIFPSDKSFNRKNLILSVYILSFLLSVLVNVFFINAVINPTLNNISSYLANFNFLRIFIIICVFTSVSIFIHSYFSEKGSTERKKLKWILFGFIVGPISFIVFWVIPQLITSHGLVPEEIIILLNNAVPVTFAIAIVKYHLMDIDYILNRSMVYSILIFILVIIYIGLILSFVAVFNISENTSTSVLSALTVAFMFLPVKQRVQKFVDKKFFRVNYNYKIAVNQFISALKEFNNVESLSAFLVKEIDKLIPVESIGVFKYRHTKKILKLLSAKNLVLKSEIKISIEKFKDLTEDVVALIEKTEREANVIWNYQNILFRYNLAVVVPIFESESKFFGLLLLGNKLSGYRFTSEDIELLKSIASTAGSTISRINLQGQLITERLAAEKLEELNEKKSLYVSSVSHDLRVPLTSIKLFTELILEDKEVLNDKIKKHLNVIEGETDRLTRLISNILDVGKIEKGTKEYHLRKIHLNAVIEDLLSVLGKQISDEGFYLVTDLGKFANHIFADEDAIKQVLENIIINSMRYSKDNKSIHIRTFCEDSLVCVKVEDKGIGISEESLQKIFDPFFRDKDDNKGIGLGLYIVKHIMDSHNGLIDIKSKPGEGTSITLKFPLTQLVE